MPRFVYLLVATLFLEVLFFAALAPLLPGLERDLGLSTSTAGLLVAMYPIGIAVGTPPATLLAMRLGVKQTLVGGLLVLSVASVAFGVFESAAAVMGARLVQGVGGAAIWIAALAWIIEGVPRERRGEGLGLAFGLAAAANIAAPAVGAIAAATGRAGVFSAAAAVGAALAAVAVRLAAPHVTQRSRRMRDELVDASGDARMRVTLWLNFVPGALMGGILVVVPLRLDRLGVEDAALAIVFAIAAIVGVVVRPLVGRWSDYVGRLRPIAATVLVLALLFVLMPIFEQRWLASALSIVLLVTVGLLWAPTTALLSDLCQTLGLGQVLAVAAMNLTTTSGIIIGSALGGVLLDALGPAPIFAALAALGLTCLPLLRASLDTRVARVGGPARAGADA